MSVKTYNLGMWYPDVVHLDEIAARLPRAISSRFTEVLRGTLLGLQSVILYFASRGYPCKLLDQQ
jgi:hypothetical protein